MIARFRVLLLAAVATATVAAPADAAPTIVSAEVQGSPLEGLTVAVVASDPKEAVNAVNVSFPEGEGQFGESACAVGRTGEPRSSGAYAGGRKVRFEIPYEPTTAGVHLLKVTVVSGACGGRQESTSTSVAATVSLGDLPPVPTLPPLPGVPTVPTARAAQSSCADADLTPAGSNLGRVRRAVLCLLNSERRARGLRAVRGRKSLRRAANRHSRDMVRRRYLDHTGPDGPDLVSRLRSVGYWPAVAAENIGAGSSTLGTARAMVRAWMNSDLHKVNILTPSWRQVGIGIAPSVPAGGSGGTYTTDFAYR